MIIQIYEVNTPDEARQCVAAGVDHIGVLVGTGQFPRERSVEEAQAIFAVVPKEHKRVALSLSMELVAAELRPDILHLGMPPEELSPDDVRTLKRRFPPIEIMRTIPVGGGDSVAIAKQYDGVADYLLLDSYSEDKIQLGATGLTHDWAVSRKIVEAVHTPVILAGGLGPENVAEAIRRVRPYGVDSKSKTDRGRTHEKDIERVETFVKVARSV